MFNVSMCQPHNDNIHWRCANAFDDAAADLGLTEVFRPQSSLLAYGFNMGLARALNQGAEFYVMLHADVEPSACWARQLIEDMNAHDLDVIHAPVRLKDRSGMTSTGIAYEADAWTKRRRLTVKELDCLPEVFTIEDVQREIDPLAKILLPNTGCHAIRIGEWCHDWCYTITDAIRWTGDKWEARTIPEDWQIGFDAMRLGLRVGGTKRVKTRHHGTAAYSSESLVGHTSDPLYARNAEQLLTQ